MKQILKTVWQLDKKNFLMILFLNIGVALMSSISVVMLIPMLDLLDVSMGEGSSLYYLLQPFETMDYAQRAMVIISAFVVLILLRALLSARATVRRNAILEKYELILRQKLHNAVHAAEWETISGKSSADLINLFSVQCRKTMFCLQWTISLIASAASAVLQLVIAMWMSFPVTLMAIVVGCGFMFLFKPFLQKSKDYGGKGVEANRKLHREIQNQLNSIKEIRAYDVEEHHRNIFDKINKDCYDISLQTTQLQVIPQVCYSVASAVLIALAFVYSVLVLNTGTAQLVILVYIFSRLWPMFSSWQGQLQSIQAYVPAFETVEKALQELSAGTRQPEIGGEDLTFQKDVRFEHVGFAYQSGNEQVLKDVSFALPYGTVTALVGPSGAGKSTTADLLLGLLHPTEGQILVDGKELTPKDLGAWRKTIGYIPQEPLILNATLRENLLRFHPEATEEEMIAALKQSLAWPFVEKLPLGLDTILGDKGLRLSGGERQRVVLARVLLGKPKFIILDEATSALDYESETFVRETIHSLRISTTVLIIAHRMATIRGADRAVVLLDGKVAEQGSLQELLSHEGGYLAGMISVESEKVNYGTRL